MNSNAKGKRGEREGAKEWAKAMCCEARRGQQFKGSPDSPDIEHSIDGIHLESKRTEKFKLYDSIEQAEGDSGSDVPVVLHRRNLKPWVAVLYLDDLPKLYEQLREYYGDSTKN